MTQTMEARPGRVLLAELHRLLRGGRNDLERPASKRELDADFIADAIGAGDLWAIARQHPGLELESGAPPADVREVCGILEMWAWLERSFAMLDLAAQTRLLERLGARKIGFHGFDGEHEGRAANIARRLIVDLGLWEVFAGRGLDSTTPTLPRHRRIDWLEWRRRSARRGGDVVRRSGCYYRRIREHRVRPRGRAKFRAFRD